MSLWTEEEVTLVTKNFSLGKTAQEIKDILIENKMVRSLEAIKKQCRTLQDKTEVEVRKFIDDLSKVKASSKQTSVPTIKSDRSLLVHFSDTHFGKVVKNLKRVVLFDSKIAKLRMEHVFAKAEELVLDKKIDDIVVILGGDLVENDLIFPAQQHHIDNPVITQTKEAIEAVWAGLQRLSDISNVRVVCVRGNHGRLKGTTSSEETSWDEVIHNTIEILAKESKRNITVSTTPWEVNLFNIQGWTCMLRHGGPPAASSAAAKAKYGNWYKMHKYDFVIFGHLHSPGWFDWQGAPVFRNGSFADVDDYVENLSYDGKPCQLLYIITRDSLPESIHPIWLEKIK